MPRVNLGKTAKKTVQYPELVNSVIRIAMFRNGIKTQRALAAAMRMDEQSISRRMTGKTAWNFKELHRLDTLFHFEDDEILQLIRGMTS